jgi:Tol biopolymer transport system component
MKRAAMPVLVFLVAAVLPLQEGQPPTRTIYSRPGAGISDDVVAPPDGRFLYATDSAGIFVIDRNTKREARVADGSAYNLALSPKGDALAFVRETADGKAEQVWTVEIDAASGKAKGTPRRTSVNQGNTPSYSPDGRWIAYATYRRFARSCCSSSSAAPFCRSPSSGSGWRAHRFDPARRCCATIWRPQPETWSRAPNGGGSTTLATCASSPRTTSRSPPCIAER